MLLKLSTETRDYVLEAEREGYWDNKIATLEKELSGMRADNEEYETKKEMLEEIKKQASKAKEHLAKYGATVWKLHSINKLALQKALAKDNIEIGKFTGKQKNVITTGSLAMLTIRAIHICKLGLDGWSNLRDENGNEIPFDPKLIEQFDESILYELANEISGVVSEDESANLS